MLLFLILNCALLIRMRMLIRGNSDLSSETDSLYLEIQSSQAELESYLVNQSIFRKTVIKKILDDLNINLLELNDKIVLFIPPYPCGVCVDNEISFLNSMELDSELAVIVPEYRFGDLRIQTKDIECISIIPYSWQDSREESDIPLNQLIYFRVNHNIINDILLPNINKRDMSYMFYSEY